MSSCKEVVGSSTVATGIDAVGMKTGGGGEGVNNLGRCGVLVVDIGLAGETGMGRDLRERDERLLVVSG